LRRLQSEAARQDAGAAFALAAERWRSQPRRDEKQFRASLREAPVALRLYDVLIASLRYQVEELQPGAGEQTSDTMRRVLHAADGAPDIIGKFVAALKPLSPNKLEFVAKYLSPKRAGRYSEILAEIDFEDFIFWRRVTKERPFFRNRIKAACGAVAREDGDRAARPDTLAKRYRRLDKRFGRELRRLFHLS
jgi:hypothetical protein